MKVIENLDLTNFNAYHIKSKCAKAYFIDTEEELVNIYHTEPKIPKIILGNGNNIILSKIWYDDHFIIFNGTFNKIEIDKEIINAQCGATMLEVSELALKNNLSGLEIFYDIPSSVGGAVVMNAGSGNEEIKNHLLKVRYLDLSDFKIKEMLRDEIGFEYRNSFFQKNKENLLLRAWFQLIPGNAEEIKMKMYNNKNIRWSKQPREFSNCGSVFKRPKNHFVGKLIDELGLKGYTIGGAQISKKHSGFIVNIGSATGQDIINLINEIKKQVKDKFKIELEVEQKII